MHLQLEQLSTIRDIAPEDWNSLADGGPFLRHEFLSALEHSGCIGPGTAWLPSYLLARDERGPAGAMPLYVKHDSRGEFVFDWGWADAYERAGRPYYPKLVAGVPFTPATGARLLTRSGCDAAAVGAALVRGARSLAGEIGASSVHVLFPTDAERRLLDGEGFLTRKGCQFHWHNDGYADFEDFLSRFSSEKRKKARRERRRVAEAGVVFEHLRGDQPTRAEWDAIFAFYSRTFLRRGRPPYLNRAFFDEIARTAPESVLIVLARHQGKPIAAAICFRGADTLYGRYWGSAADFHSLHFETCYHQGIEYCIREGIRTFEPGTQGEHKIARGFTPQATWSSHWLRDPAFHAAVADFLLRETPHVDAYIEELDEHVPYRQDAGVAPT
ncbi:MAG TPA: GNAT family N-acetyltransferase [Gammaproteobacteria bacterium]|nr:GNAT family N-acetyltransferase [Gammaproteobacteria bacterium]